jgi:hypothetical protein
MRKGASVVQLTKLRAPVVLFTYRRPKTTAIIANKINDARPTKVYLVSNWPKDGQSEDKKSVLETRQVLRSINWNCPVEEIFADSSLGLRDRFESAFDYIFEREERLITLEDDLVPGPSFFSFVDEMLEQFVDDQRISVISGMNPLGTAWWDRRPFGLSRMHVTWGWGTWKDRWQSHRATDIDLDTIEAHAAEYLGRKFEAAEVARFVQDSHLGKIDTFDYPLYWTFVRQGNYSVVAPRSQIRNIGSDAQATHTKTMHFFWNQPEVKLNLRPHMVGRYERSDALLDWARSRLLFPNRMGIDLRIARIVALALTGRWL